MFETTSVNFQYVNEQAAHVKIDHDSRQVSTWAAVIPPFLLLSDVFRFLGFYE